MEIIFDSLGNQIRMDIYLDYCEVLCGYDFSNSLNLVIVNYNNIFGSGIDGDLSVVSIDELFVINGCINIIFIEFWNF